MPPPPAVEPAVVETAPAVEAGNVVAFPAPVRRWRNIATAMSAIAAALIALVVTQVVRPDLLPDGIRPKPRTQVVEVKTPPPPAPAQYVAVPYLPGPPSGWRARVIANRKIREYEG